MKHITSRKNPLVARYRAIGRSEVADLMLLDGVHLVADALDAGLRVRQAVTTTAARARPEVRAIAERLDHADVEVVVVTAPVMDALTPLHSSSTIVVIADRPARDDERLYAAGTPLVVIASDVQDPGNMGSIVRVAEAGGATGVVATGTCADPFGWKALRGSMGSALRLPVAVHDRPEEAIVEARRHGCRVIATLPRGGRPLFDVELLAPMAVLVGGEGAGLTTALVETADERITIPMQPHVESLNAAVSAALVVYEARRQRSARAQSREACSTQPPAPSA